MCERVKRVGELPRVEPTQRLLIDKHCDFRQLNMQTNQFHLYKQPRGGWSAPVTVKVEFYIFYGLHHQQLLHVFGLRP